ncbi:hypothetical protein KCP71_14925 [Salmonella enterica subsp. enterica]|nr:hypothetical protein KCP71_14925 [Salmonella enterica subsp. enterica]
MAPIALAAAEVDRCRPIRFAMAVAMAASAAMTPVFIAGQYSGSGARKL